jgi:5-formyltetrahydrofolate cyclo-ligase
MLKSELRKDIRERKRQFSNDQLREQSLPLIHVLLSHPRIQAAKVVLLYESLPDEVDTHDAIEQLCRQGKAVLLPVVKPQQEMELREYQGAQSMLEDEFHILEPTGPSFQDYARIDVAVIPGMSFDGEGNRLGRGKGYYDRFLRKIPSVYKIGICFDFQRVEHVPTEATDIPVDEVI